MRELAARALIAQSLDGDLLELRFRPGVEDAMIDLVERERECCSFLDFQVETGDELVVQVRAPKGTEPALQGFAEAFLATRRVRRND